MEPSANEELRKRLEADSRVDPRLKRALIDYIHIFGGAGFLASRQYRAFPTREAIVDDFNIAVKAYIQRLQGLPNPKISDAIRRLWRKDDLEMWTEKVRSTPDGNEIKLSIIRPKVGEMEPDRSTISQLQKRACVVYLHGGAMAFNSAFDPQYQVVGRMLARQGMVCVLVDFRNSVQATRSNPHVAPYPAGLNDCYSALQWVNANVDKLGVDPAKILLAGESGGGNLTIATAMKCKREDTLKYIPSGFYAICPYIAGSWPADVTNANGLGTSHLYSENNGVFLHLGGMMNEAIAYGREAYEKKDPLAWPSFATVDDLKGLPKCMIVVNEVWNIDFLLDYSLSWFRLLEYRRGNRKILMVVRCCLHMFSYG